MPPVLWYAITLCAALAAVLLVWDEPANEKEKRH